jgi:hypothetical protein
MYDQPIEIYDLIEVGIFICKTSQGWPMVCNQFLRQSFYLRYTLVLLIWTGLYLDPDIMS